MNLDDLTIVVPTRDEERNIFCFLDSIPSQINLIVVDAGSDRTANLVHLLRPERSLVVKSSKRISAARHLGAKLAKTPWILFTDADVHFSKDYFRIIQNISLPDAVYGPKLSKDEFKSYYLKIAKWQAISDRVQIPSVSGSNFLVDRNVYFSCGGFDQGLVVNEDSELGWRIQRNGFKIFYNPDLVTYAHDHRRLYHGIARKTFHSLLRCALLYLNLMPDRWRLADWGYWNTSFK